MADTKPSVSDWLDDPSDSPFPHLQDEKAIGDWLDDAPPSAAIEQWLDAPDDVKGGPRGFGAAFDASLRETPGTFGAGLEATGKTSGIDMLARAGQWIENKTKTEDSGFRPLTWADIHGLGDAWDWVKEQAGAGVASTIPSVLSGLAGAGAGGLAGSVVPGLGTGVGATVGGVAGASSTAIPLNIGDAYKQFVAEGIDDETAAKAGTYVGAAISIPDVFSTLTLTKPFTSGAKKVATDLVVKTIAQRIKSGMTVEAATEGLQQMIQEAAAAALGGDATLPERAENVVGSMVGGGLGGGVVSGATGVADKLRTKPAPTPPPPTTPPGAAPPAATPPAATPPPIPTSGPPAAGNATAAPGTPSPGAAVEPSPPAAVATTPPPAAAAPPAPPTMEVGAVVGVKNKDAPPKRAQIEAVQDGYVFWRDDDGNQQADKVEEFKRDLTVAPPPKRPDSATTIQAPPREGEPPPHEVGDINDFDPFAPREPVKSRPPAAPSPQGTMALPDTAKIAALKRQAVLWDKSAAEATEMRNRGIPNARTPEEITYMRRAADEARAEAAELERKIAPPKASNDPLAATPEQMAARGLGPLAAAAPAQSEAVTGPQQFAVTPAKAAPAPAQPSLEPVENSEAVNPPPPVERPQPAVVPWQDKLRAQIKNRAASINDPVAIARNLGVTPEEVSAELRAISAGRNAPIQIMQGTVKKDKKTGQMVQSAKAGKYRYTPRPTGKVVQSLSDFVYDSGGMAAGSFAGELEARDLHKVKRAFKGWLLKPHARMSVEDMADAAMHAGYPIPKTDGTMYQGKNDDSAYHADVDAFLDMLTADHSGRRKHYPIGEEPVGEDIGRPATDKERRQQAAAELKALGFEPKGKTTEELEAQLDAVLDAIGVATPLDALDLGIQAEQQIADSMDAEAQQALEREAGYDDPGNFYDTDEWLAAEQAEAASAAQPAADRGVSESGRDTGDQSDRQESTAAGDEGAEAAADRAGEKNDEAGETIPNLRLEVDSSSRPGEIRDLTSIFVRVAGENADEAQLHRAAADWVVSVGNRTGNEYAVALSADGKVLGAWTSDDPKAIEIPRDVTLALMYGPRVTIHHNHPLGGPLSLTDIGLLEQPWAGWIVANAMAKTGGVGSVSAARLSDSFVDHPTSSNLERRGKIVDWATKRAMALSLQMNRKLFDAGRLSHDLWEISETAWRALHRAGIIDYSTTIPMADVIEQNIQLISNAIAEGLAENGYHLTSQARNRGSTASVSPNEGLAGLSRGAEKDAAKPADQAADRRGEGDDRTETPGRQLPDSAEGSAAPKTLKNQDSTSVLARLLKDESGALSAPNWAKVKEALGLKKDAAAVAREGNAIKLGAPGTLQSLSKLGRYLRSAVSLAAVDRPSSVYWNAILRRDHIRAELERAAIEDTRPYFALDEKQRDRVNKVLEHDRLYGVDRTDTGRTVVVKIPDRKVPFGTGKPELSKPGEIVALDATESQALHALRKFLDTRLMEMGEAVARERGYKGEFTKAGIEKVIREANHPRTKRIAESAKEVFEQTQEMRRTGYVPFQRYGDKFILVKPKLPESATPETAWFELIDTKSVFDNVYSREGGKPRRALQDKLAELHKRFPPDKFDYQVGEATPKAVQALNIPAMERAFAALNLKQGSNGAKIIDDLMHQVYEQRKAGLRKQSQNVPGYSVDFERALSDYVRQTSAIIARMSTRNDVDSAYDALQSHPSKEVRDYWEKHKQHTEDEGGDYAGLRKLGFFMFLWGTLGAVGMNLTQTPLVTQMQLGTWAGLRAPGLAHGALLEALRSMKIGREGLELDFDALGKTDAEKAMLKKLRAEGRFDPSISEDIAGSNLSTRRAVRPHLSKLKRVYEIGASAFNASETANRVAAALAYFRAAQNPQLRDKMKQVYSKDENFKELVGNKADPMDIARFGVDETQFIGGKINRAPIMRGVGAVVLQFKTYIANYIRLMHKNFTRMGPQGKMAGGIMLISLLMAGGLMGLPGAEDLLGIAEAILGAAGIDPMLEYRFREWLDDAGFGEYGAEVLTRGFGRDVFGSGVDIGSRLGMGNIFPDNSLTSLAPVITGTVGNAINAFQRNNSGQPIGAAAAIAPMILGKGPSDLIKGFGAYGQEGISTKKGNFTVFPEDVTLADMVTRALGFQPTKATRAGERQYQQSRLANATKDARTALLTNIARLVVFQEIATKNGDTEAAQEYAANIDQLFAANAAQLIDPSIPDWQKIKPPTRQAIKSRVLSLMKPEIAAIRRAGKLSREEMTDMPFVEP